MRLLIIAMCTLSAGAFAQQRSGSYGGYVSGWAYDNQRPSTFIGNRNLAATVQPYIQPQQVNPYWAAQAIAAQQLVAQQTFVEEQARVARREREANDRAMVIQEQLAQQEQALADQRVQLAQQQRLAAERELAAQQQKLAAVQEAAAQQLSAAAQQQQIAAQQLADATAQRQKEEDERRRTEVASKPREKGPEIYRWTDDEGTVHLSTKPPHR